MVTALFVAVGARIDVIEALAESMGGPRALLPSAVDAAGKTAMDIAMTPVARKIKGSARVEATEQQQRTVAALTKIGTMRAEELNGMNWDFE